MKLQRILSTSVHGPIWIVIFVTITLTGVGVAQAASSPTPKSNLNLSNQNFNNQNLNNQPSLKNPNVLPEGLKAAVADARYSIDAAASGERSAENQANGISVRFSGAETVITTRNGNVRNDNAGSGALVKLHLVDFGWGTALQPVGPITHVESTGKRLDRHYRTALKEWFSNSPEGLEQGFVIARRAAHSNGPLRIRLESKGGWNVRGSGERIFLSKGATTLTYSGLKAWDAHNQQIPSRLIGTASGIEIQVDDARAIYPLTVDPTFTQQQELIGTDATAGNEFGWSVALSTDGNTALAGAHSGAAYAFTRTDGVWTQQQKLIVLSGVGLSSVALSGDGNTALVSTYLNSNPGVVYVFTRAGVVWSQVQTLMASDGAANDAFGNSVALSSDGNTALVGAPGKNTLAGAAYVFARSGASWTQQQEVGPTNPVGPVVEFGFSVSLSGDGNSALVGAVADNDAQGSAYVLTRSGGLWTTQQELTAADGVAESQTVQGDRFGISVALSSDGSTALVGASYKSFEGNLAQRGAAYVFSRSGTSWTQQQELGPSDPELDNYFGVSVALSTDGNTALVGAWGTALTPSTGGPNLYADTGSAYTFTRFGTNWSQPQEITAADRNANYWFGYSVALSNDGNTGLIGSWGNLMANPAPANRGAAYVFAVSALANVTITSTPPGVLFSSSGAGCAPGSGYTTPQALAWSPGSSCTVTLGSLQSGTTGTRYVFNHWEDASTFASRTITAPAAATNYSATFDTQYQLTTGLTPVNGGSVTPASGQFYTAGTAVNLQAAPTSGYVFTNWTGDVAVAVNAATTVTMSAPETVTANFRVVGGTAAKVGIFRSGYFWLEDVDGNQQFNSPPDRAFAFGGIAGDIPITGDWNGTGISKVGIYRPSNGLFILDTNGDGIFNAGDLVYNLGVGTQAGDIPVVGDWNGSGTTKVGLFRQGFFWILDTNGNGVFEQGTDTTYAFGGVAGDVPVVGDWTGSGTTKIGLFRLGFYWILDANGNGQLDNINGIGGDQAFAYGGIAGDVPVVGDWNGGGTSKVGVFRSGFFWVLDGNGNHSFDGTGVGLDFAFPFGGLTGDKPVVGKW